MTTQEKQKQQSKEWLANSLLILMQTKPFENISISEIAAHADLSRRTFYRAFSSKTDIIVYIIERILPEYITALKQLENINMQNISLAFFQFAHNHQDIISLLKKHHLEYYILDLFNKYLPVIRHHIFTKPLSGDEEVEKIFLLISGAGFFNILMYWINNNQSQSPEELATMMSKAISIFSFYE